MNYAQYRQQNRTVTILDMRHSWDVLSDLALKGINKYIREGKKIGLILNKGGYHTSIMCRDCGEIVFCQNCHLPLTIHGNIDSLGFAMCHCCRTTYTIPHHCEHCKSTNLHHRGVGLEQLAEIIKHQTGVIPLCIQSTNTNSQRKAQTSYEQRDKHQIIIGTSLVGVGNSQHQFDLLIYVNADQGLGKPDFNATFDTFYQIREGVQHHPGAAIVIQTHNPDHAIRQFIGNDDQGGFIQRDQQYKQTYHYPPYSQICVLMYKHEIQSRVYRTVQKLYNELTYLKEYHKRDDIQLYQTPPLVFKKFGKFHYHIIFKGPEIRSFIDMAFPLCKIYERGFKVDWEPRNLV